MGRKANGEGTITKLPSGNYRLRAVNEIDGLMVRKSFTASSPTACRKAHKEWLASDNKVPIERVKTVGEWANYWLEVYKKPQPGRPIGAYKDYKMYVELHINPVIGGLNLKDVRPAHVVKLFKDAKTKPNKNFPEGRPLSRSSAEKLLWALEGIFNTAVENNLCVSSPVKNIELPPKSKKALSVFQKEHMKRIVSYINEHEYGPYIALYLYSGLRPGEGFGLMWVDIDRKNNAFNVRRSLTLVDDNGKNTYQITLGIKSDDERVVTYNEALNPLLDKIPKTGMYVMSRAVEVTNDLGEKQTIHKNHTHSSYNEIYYRFFSDINKTLSAEEQIPRLTPHKMRHTFATYLRKAGADLDEIRELLGHKSVSTTQIYDTVDIDDMKSTVAKLSY